MQPRPNPVSRAPRGLAICLLLALLAPACASVSLERSTQTSGTYESEGWSFTLFAIDMPSGALSIARENAADFHLANTTETSAKVTPDLGWFNWVLDIISVRKATVKGTWGFADH
ncbi:MAG: hypothetical protein P1V35_14400 [Planctomycetota bacterium]|nr:hypothetical protein [Planctomycetota bacterium]